MKKIIVILFLFAVSDIISFDAFAAKDETKVIMRDNSENKKNRSMLSLPEVLIDTDTEQLSVCFSSSNAIFTITITDENENIVFQSFFVADGSVYDFDLPMLYSGEYTIVIQGNGGSYMGCFCI